MNGSPPRSDRYVFMRPGALGDALLALPALALVRRDRPAAHVTLVARPDVLALARSSGLAKAVSSYDEPAWSPLFAAEPPSTASARAVVAGSAVVAWLRDVDGTVSRNLAALGARQAIVAPGRPAPGSGVHAALLLARSLAPLGITVPARREDLPLPALRPSAEDEARALATWRTLALPGATPVVALHAGSGGAAKRWPPERFAALVSMLYAAGMQPLLVEGPQDAEVTVRVGAACVEPPPPVARHLGIGALAALLSRCAGYVGNDSGVTHLAGLDGVPTLALFGPSDPALWAPLGPRACVLRSPTEWLADVPASAVWEALAALLQPLGG